MKLRAAAAADFQQVELGFDDLLAWTLHEDTALKPLPADQRASWAPDEPDPFKEDSLWQAINAMAKQMGARDGGLCHQLGLGISILQPFSQFEGWPAKSERCAAALASTPRLTDRAQAEMGCAYAVSAALNTP
jgi:hypothetical protein